VAQGVSAPRASGRLSGAVARRAVRDALAVVPVVLTKIELWKPERLIPLERNPRTHTDAQITEIAASMREFGFLWPIMVNGKTRRIVAGNGRYAAALQLGLPVVPVVEERHLTPIQRRAFIIADNKIALNAGWASDILAATAGPGTISSRWPDDRLALFSRKSSTAPRSYVLASMPWPLSIE
jgi:ParB/Sulfiredoxin domain